MKLITSLSAKLLLDLSAIIGSRVYPLRLPDASTAAPNVLPAITYQLISDPLKTTHSGHVTRTARVQIDAYAETYKEAHAVADALELMHGYRGQMGDVTVGNIFRDSLREEAIPNAKMYSVSQDFVIRYKE